MSQFPSASHLASWAGICPGNNESAGKRKSGKTPKGNRWLRRTLSEAAWGASRTKETYLSAQYQRLCPRRGKKRAIVAVAHSILKVCYHILNEKVRYVDLGYDYFNKTNHEKYKKYYIKKLESLGLKVSIDNHTSEVA